MSSIQLDAMNSFGKLGTQGAVGIKKANKRKPGSKATDKCSVNPQTGDVYDGQGEHIGNLGEGH